MTTEDVYETYLKEFNFDKVVGQSANVKCKPDKDAVLWILNDLEVLPENAYFVGDGETDAVFQLESPGMKRFMRDLRPSTFEDIIAMVALYRPGPMQFIDSFIRRKHGAEEISYLHPGLENSLKKIKQTSL